MTGCDDAELTGEVREWCYQKVTENPAGAVWMIGTESEVGERLARYGERFRLVTSRAALPGTCDADGYVPVGTMGDERYWHCERPAVVIDPEGLRLCAEHAEEYWPDLIPGLLP